MSETAQCKVCRGTGLDPKNTNGAAFVRCPACADPSPSPSEGASEVPKEIKLLFWRIMEYSQRPDQGVLVLRDELREQTRELRARITELEQGDITRVRDICRLTQERDSARSALDDAVCEMPDFRFSPNDSDCGKQIAQHIRELQSSLREKARELAETRRIFLENESNSAQRELKLLEEVQCLRGLTAEQKR